MQWYREIRTEKLFKFVWLYQTKTNNGTEANSIPHFGKTEAGSVRACCPYIVPRTCVAAAVTHGAAETRISVSIKERNGTTGSGRFCGS